MGQDSLLFVPIDGGLGTSLSCTGSSSRSALSNPTGGSVYAINNTGTDNVFLAFGDSSIVATSSYQCFPPGITLMAIPNARGSGAPTYVAGITGGTTIVVQVTPGNTVG